MKCGVLKSNEDMILMFMLYMFISAKLFQLYMITVLILSGPVCMTRTSPVRPAGPVNWLKCSCGRFRIVHRDDFHDSCLRACDSQSHARHNL